MRGRFVTLEGIDGAGKSTHLDWLAAYLEKRGIPARVTREPGGTEIGEKLRQLLLDRHQKLHPETEALLMFAARREHLDKVIVPALEAGSWVLCDRFTDATFAYQSGGSGIEWHRIEELERWVQRGLQPDITLYFDVPPEVGRERSGRIKSPDRFEQEQGDFYRRVRAAYLRRAREHPARIRVIDAARTIPEIQKELEEVISTYC
ncbi:MAG: dTMP kinase [Burkholderiales bacterium]